MADRPVSGGEAERHDARQRWRAVMTALACAMAVIAVGAVRGQTQTSPTVPPAVRIALPGGYAGSPACASCHAAETAAWAGSQHRKAMEPATSATVLGDFEGATAEHFGSKARFLKRDGRYVVETEGRDGKTAAFPVDWTFGIAPLQQYLTAFPDGRVQALPYAWDTRPKEAGGQRWFHLYPGEAIPPGDALHWTGAQQNWNHMCADCHATAVRKGYDAASDRFATSASELGVGCESCHGPGAAHVAWAGGGRPEGVANKGFASVAAKRPVPDWTPDPATGSPAKGVARVAGDEVETCASCHARRGSLAEVPLPGHPLTDFYRPALLTPDLFEDDGQMKDEVFNDASFRQSKMFAKGVVCGDCHDPHSAKLKADGAQVCAQCHLPEKFATISHTGHADGPGQPDCVSCHMPARTYMVVDRRHDHSFRIPRPDVSAKLGTPNACNDCHADKAATWAAEAVERWHGPVRKGFQTWTPAFHAARTGAPEARDLLLSVANDPAAPAVARATALQHLQARPSAATSAALARGLSDADPLVRIAALGGLASMPPPERWRAAARLLSDPVLAVRLEALTQLAEGPPPGSPAGERQAFDKAAAEYVASETLNADRPENRANLAHFYARQGRAAEAEREYLAAMKLTPSVAPRVDLADLYRATGREQDAELLLRQTISIDPKAAAPRHALGLSLIRQKRYPEAVEALGEASRLAPGEPRYAYVHAVALQSTGRPDEAVAAATAGLAASPSDVPLLSFLLQDALKRRDLAGALGYAERLGPLMPDDASLAQLTGKLRTALGKAP
jgi:predicted CXXCH cytochrome family protein